MEPRDTNTPGRRPASARGGCSLATVASLAGGTRHPEWMLRGGLTDLMVRRCRLPSPTDAPLDGGTLRLLWSSCNPRKGVGRGRAPYRRMTRPFRHAYRPGLLRTAVVYAVETTWDFHRSVWTAIVFRRNHQPPSRSRTTTVTRRTEGSSRWAIPRLRQLAERGLPTCRNVAPPKLSLPGPSVAVHCWTTLATYLPQGEFEQRLPHGHGPARVGLDRSVWIDRTVYRLSRHTCGSRASRAA